VPRGADPLAAFAVFVGKIASAREFVIGSEAGAIAVQLDPGEPLAAFADRLASVPRVTSLAPSPDPARHPLFDVGFGEGEPVGDLHLQAAGGLYVLEYDAQLFSDECAHRLSRALDQVLRAQAATRVGSIGLLGEAEASELLAELSTPDFNWPQHFLLHELFEARVDREPDATALVFGDIRVSYRELEARANVLAQHLIALGLGPDSIVALVQDRGVEMIVAIVGVLKAGAAYLPIEPDAPADRVRYLLDDSGAAAVVTTSTHAGSLAHPHVIAVDRLTGTAERPPRRAEPHHLAYVIYTSGSTGQPKGVLVEHRNVVHFIFAEKEDFAIRPSDAVIHTSSYTFDASIDQIWLALTGGAKLVLVTKQMLLDPAELSRVIDAEGVTHVDTVPALLGELSPMLASVRQVVVGGETCPVAVARAWSRTTRFWNEYGPTETTVGSLRHLVDPAVDLGTRVPIGRPIGLTRVYVLDWGGCPVPIGVRGELFLGGAGVARGYLARDELTKERFVADPFAGPTSPGARMYKTGDVVAWNAEGGIEFFGRVDSQVKVRGFRIELGEIEAALEKHADVSGAAASVLGRERLVAHFVASRPLDAAELRGHLGRSLPAYMVPDFFVQLDAFPRTVSGKIDRKSLPPPQLEAGEIELPANQIESELRALWGRVLGVAVDQIGVTRSFFELGGHSLLVMQLLARVREKLGVVLAAQTVLGAPTIRAMAQAIADRPTEGALARAEPGTMRPATSVQRRMYVIHQGAPFNTSDNLPLLYALDGTISERDLGHACTQLIERHESLRTAFFFHEGEIVQKVALDPRFQLERYEGDLERACAAFVRPFQLDDPPLFRAAVFVNADRVTHLAFDMHHIVSDGISIDVLLEDLLALIAGRELPPVEARYFDYSAWLDSDDAKRRQAGGRVYWTKLLADEPPVLDLPYDFRRPLTRNQAAGEIGIELPAELVERVARFARDREATPFAFFAALYSVFLSCMTGGADVGWGFPSAGRPHPDLDRVVGMFVNTLVFRMRLSPEATFDQVLRAAMTQIRDSLRNEDTPFEDMIGELPTPPPGRNALFDTMLSYEGRMPDEYRLGDALLREQPLPHRFARTDLAVVIRERSSGGYWVRFEYSADLFKRSTAERFARLFAELMERVLTSPMATVAELPAMDAAEREQVLHGFNATAHPVPDVGGVHLLFERHAAERPDAAAVTLEHATLTYAQVEARANALAHMLARRGAGRETIVGILLDPCTDMLVSVLGVLKAGAAFMPIDPDYPQARKLHMMRDSGARVLLSRGALADSLRDCDAEILDLDDPRTLADVPTTRPSSSSTVRGSDLAYVIYTSGSTGTPKGTLLEHAGLVNLATWYVEYAQIQRGDGVSKFAGFGFDASIYEIVPAFVAGGSLVIVPAELRLQVEQLSAYFEAKHVRVAFLPTQFGEQFMRASNNRTLHAVTFAGEKLRTYQPVPWRVINGYGPTEYTVCATACDVDHAYDNIPIGKPIWNTQILVLDRLGRPSPIGVPGELCIAGAGIARGYLNRPDLTADKFVDHPFEPGRRIYRTGDLARWLPDGNLEFLGRIDTQVKVRGFRIELGEIEQALSALPGIESAVVVAVENPAVQGDVSLVAYIVAAGTTQAASEGTLKGALGQALPAYMIPSRIVHIAEMPVTANGKVDKRALPPVDVETAPVVEPRDARERELRDLYAEVLGRAAATISVEASFMSLGGHSLKAAGVLSAIYKRYGIQLKFSEFLDRSSVAEVALVLATRSADAGDITWERAPEGQALPLTSSQQRIFAVHQLSTWSTAYNIPFAWELGGEVDAERLAVALEQLVARHHALRAEFFVGDDGVPRQRFRDDAKLALETLQVEEANLYVTLDRFVRPFDLARSPLARAALVRTERRLVLALDVHHIIIDGLSVRLLLDDLEALYAGNAGAATTPTFADYVWWETGAGGRAQRDAERSWWLERFAEQPSPLELPTDFDRPPRMAFEGDDVTFDLPPETATPLIELANTQGITPLGVFFAAWAIVLSRLGNTPDLVIGVPASGRQRRGIETMVGMFVNTLPLRVKLGADESFAALCVRLGREAAEAFEHQSYQLNDLVTDLGLARDPSRNPLFDVMFAWQGADFAGAEAAGSPLGLRDLPNAHVEAKFDLELTVQHGEHGVQVALVYATKLFQRATAERFLGHVRSVLEQAARDPNARVRDFVMLQAWERELLLEEFNRTSSPLPELTLVDLFTEHARERPAAIAAVDERGEYTYAEVDRRSSILAHELVARGVVADDVVALALPRSRELLVAILGVMKAGAGYLPIEPDAPAERATAILEDSGARLLVADGAAFAAREVVAWSSLDWTHTHHVTSRAGHRGIAYVIYTSGSTGKPKGVVIEHRGAVNFVTGWQRRFGITRDERVLLFASYTFDASIAQMGVAMAAGACTVVASKAVLLDHDAFETFVREHRVTHLDVVPLFLSGLAPKQPLGLRRIVVAGDICPSPVAARWIPVQPTYNAYGPTETTVGSLVHEIRREDLARQRIPIGRPIANTKIFILDWTGNVAPLGVPGEMYIGGAGVARGYLNRPELTAERFVQSPFSPGERLYRSGDVARWLPAGVIDFLGRSDNQIKIRGFRVELGEIEAAIVKHPAVAEAAVMVTARDRDKKLAGYVVLRGDATPTALRTFLARTLPAYMVPDAIVIMQALPITTSGKIDRKQLPEPVIDDLHEDDTPATVAEEKLIELWAEVLKLPAHKIPLERSFFELGGHSLLIMVLIARIQQTFSVRISVSDVFSRLTVRALAELIDSQDHAAIVPIPVAPAREYYPLSSTQRRMFAIHQANPLNLSYNMPTLFAVEGRITPERLEETARALIARHASLRTSFHVVQGEPVTRIHASAPFALRIIESDAPADEVMESLVQPFDLTEAPLFRVILVRRSNGDELLVVDLHHIIGDGASMSVLWREVVDILRGVALPPPRLTMGDYAVWQQSAAHQPELAAQRRFWLDEFAELPAPLQLPYDLRPPAVRSFAGDLVAARLTKQELEAIAALSRAHGSTAFATVLACWFMFLSRIGGTDDVVVGVPVAGRMHPDVQELVGMFVNTVPWRARIPATGTFLDFLTATREHSLRVLASQEYELEALIEELGVQAAPGRNPLFDTMFVYQAHETDSVIDAVRVRLHQREFVSRTAKLDLTLIATELEDGIELGFEYASELFERATVERLAGYFATLVREILRAPDRPLAELDLLAPSDRERVIVEFNATAHELPEATSTLQLFEDHVRRAPDAPAVVMNDLSWSYRDVDRRANAIARWLGERGIGRDDVVGLLLDPCAEQLPAILGVHRAGAAFLPIDSEYPIGRKHYLLADSGARVLLTRGALDDGIAFAGARLDVARAGEAADARRVAIRSDDAAYVIYTSGSTGKPKGVMIEHGNLLNFASWYASYYGIAPGDGVAKYAGFSFDASISEIVPCFVAGGTLVVVPAEMRLQPKELSAYFDAKAVRVAFLPTQFGEQFMRMTDNRSLRIATLAGEKLRSYRAVPWQIVNGYGPTEYTVCTTAFIVDRPYDNIPIGKPIWNTQVLVLDRRDRPCPVGIVGELCVAGAGVARGYLNRPELTAEKFVAHPLQPGARMYRTGDLARWRHDGNLEYLGRIDTQVKVRGFRIELGEIEQALVAVPGVREAVVIDVKDDAGVVQLAGYLVGDVDEATVRTALARDLPDYMIPSLWCRLDALPVTPNGKVDRRALPAVQRDAGGATVPPADDRERTLVACFAGVLGLDAARISVTASFFELGGQSLKAIALVGEVYKQLGVELKVSDVFRSPTVRALAKRIAQHGGSAALASIEPAPAADSYAASSVQTRMFLLQQMEPASTAYNVPGVFALAPHVTRDALARALSTLVARHDALRCEFALDDARVRLRLVAGAELELVDVVATEAEREQLANELVRPFALDHAPLARAAWITTERGAYLFFDMHHIATDGASMAMLLDELETLLAGGSLSEPPVSLVDCTTWEHGEAATAMIRAQREFWKARFPDGAPALGLVTDFARPATVDPAGDVVSCELPVDTVRAVRELGQRRGISLHALLLAAFDVLLARLTRQDEIAVGSAVSGRWHPDMQRTVGMFVNTLVLANVVDPKQPFIELADDVARRSIEALDNQAFPFADLVELVGDARHAGHTPLIDVMFTLQNAVGDRGEAGAAALAPCAVETRSAKFDLSLVADERPDGLALAMEYRTSLFRSTTIERYLAAFVHLIGDLALRPDVPVEQLSILTDDERRLVQVELNATDRAYPARRSAQAMFEEVARRLPNKRALVARDVSFTYGQVEQAANRLAHRLIASGVQRDSIVAILSQPCCELFIAELAVLKAGGAFLPIDHRHPRERIEYMLRDSAARVLIAEPGRTDDLDWAGPHFVLEADLFGQGPATPPGLPPSTDALAYVIYTSGSTGRPKGVMIEHASLIAYVQRSIEAYAVDQDARHSKYMGIGFDPSMLETFPVLSVGGELHVVPDHIRLSVPELAAWLGQHEITWTCLPTQLGEELMKVPPPAKLRCLVVGGDRLRRFTATPYRLVNEYGPTECTVAATHFIVDAHYDNIPIGKPIANTKILILDPAGQLCPRGVAGELCIAGSGVGRGYLGAPELTAKKFVVNALAGGRMYHTGDLARWLDDGNVEFLGRIDSQVKIRGYRVELGEIERAMLEVPGISACAVIDHVDAAGDKFLCAYHSGGATSEAEIRDRLGRRLPDYMVPAIIMAVAEIPLTTNGKVDRRRLPTPELPKRDRVIVPPANPAETLIVQAFARVLARTDYGALDDFFELGGNSLKAVAAVAVLATDFQITTNDLFRLRTPRAIATELPMKRGDLQGRLVALVSELRSTSEHDPLQELGPDLERYRARYKPYAGLAVHQQMSYRDVLLTGSTGFLGSYLLRDLLERTDAKVHVTMRAKKRQEAWDRLASKTTRYFGKGFLERHARRVHLVLGDLSEPSFGLDRTTFDALTRTVDCIVHSAALTKHYGEYASFQKANVDATANLVTLARRAGCDFNLISTISVGAGDIPGKKRALFTEFDCDIGQVAGNHYVRTKLDAEKLVHALRDEGHACNVFRVGFLTGDSKTLTFQDNADDSGFVQTLKSYLALRKIPLSALAQSFCPVNEVSDAIVRLLGASSLLNQTHHIDRHIDAEDAERILTSSDRAEPMDEAEFYEWLAAHVSDPQIGPAATSMLLHQGLLDDRLTTETITLREKTDRLLARTAFSWSPIRAEQVWSLLD
jgi:tyrocidine synthetase-3